MEFANQFGAGVIVSYALEYLKQSNKFHFLNEADTGTYKAIIGFLAALVTTVGIHYTFDYDVSAGGQLVLTLPSLSAAMHGAWDFARQWAFQQASYDGFVRRREER